MVLNRLFYFATGYSHSRWKLFYFWKLLVLEWKSSNIAPLREHPVYIIFNLCFSFSMNLACWFSFDSSCLNSMFKTYLFLNFMCSAKEASIFFFLWSTLYLLFSMCNVSWFLIVDFTLSLVTQTPGVKRSILKFLGVLQKKQRYWYGTLKNDLSLGWFWFITGYKDSLRKTY